MGLTLLTPGAKGQKVKETSAPVNEVLEWNAIFIDALIATGTPNSSSQRLGAIVHYPSTVEISDAVGETIAHYINRNSMQKLRGPHVPRR